MGFFDFLFDKKPSNSKNNGTEKPSVLTESESQLLAPIEVAPGLTLPYAFAQKWDEIERTRLVTNSITATVSSDLSLEQSKFGYYPCMPLDFEYPTDSNGQPMFPLAQINFSEMPKLEGFPESGYLQIYISSTDDIYGIDFDESDSQLNFRVLFFEESEVEKYKADFSFLEETMNSDSVPVFKPHRLDFYQKDEYIGEVDFRSQLPGRINLTIEASKYPVIEDELESVAYDTFTSNGHKLGGYAYFTQADPRDGVPELKEHILLLQIDSDTEIMWGDAGVANFFIHPNDLARRDFSKVIYNWDCS